MLRDENWNLSGVDNNVSVSLNLDKLDLHSAVEFVRSPNAGALIVFAGTTRDTFHDKDVTELSYEAHNKLALKSLLKIAETALDQFKNAENNQLIHKIYIVHRLGVVPVGEESVIITLSSTHRQEGWNAAMFILEEIKKKVEIWKNEIYSDGTSSWKENGNWDVDGH